MRRQSLASWVAALGMAWFLLSAGAWAQHGGGGGGGGELGSGSSDPSNRGLGDIPPEGSAGMPGGGAARAAAPKAKTPEEAQAVQAVLATAQAPGVTGDQLDAAIDDFSAKYSKSDFLLQIRLLGVQYYQTRDNLPKLLLYGQEVLQTAPENLFTLSSMGTSIPAHLADSDPNRAALLKNAEDYNKKTLNLADAIDAQGGRGAFVDGHHYTADQAKIMKVGLIAGARRSLGRVALLRGQYSSAIDQYGKAIPLEADDAARAKDYYYLAQAQEGARKNAEASASLEKAAALGASDADLQQLVAAEQAKLKGAH